MNKRKFLGTICAVFLILSSLCWQEDSHAEGVPGEVSREKTDELWVGRCDGDFPSHCVSYSENGVRFCMAVAKCRGGSTVKRVF